MLFKKPAATKVMENWTQEDDLYLIEQVNQALLAVQKPVNQAELELVNKTLRACQALLAAQKKALLAAQKKALLVHQVKFKRARLAVLACRKLLLLANQALMDKQAALKKKNQLWWEQMWEQIRISLRLGIATTPFMVAALISLKYHLDVLDVLEHAPTSMLTDCTLPEKNIPTNDVPENSSVWNFKPTTNGIMGIALASCIVCAVPIYIITKHFLY
mgnify:CR=1 FL=1